MRGSSVVGRKVCSRYVLCTISRVMYYVRGRFCCPCWCVVGEWVGYGVLWLGCVRSSFGGYAFEGCRCGYDGMCYVQLSKYSTIYYSCWLAVMHELHSIFMWCLSCTVGFVQYKDRK